MSDVHNHGFVNKQVNNPIIQGDLVIYGEQKVKRYLTQLPTLDEKIIGREKAISRLKDALDHSQQVVLMNGMGGIGKTTTAIAYANRYKNQYVHLVWLEQLSDFHTDVATNKLLTQNLEITPSGDTVADTQFILNSLSNLGGKSLLVIDNGNEQLKYFKNYFPKSPDWHVLITSRQELSFVKKMPLDFLTKEDALTLFYSHYKIDRNDDIAHEILLTVDYHTLTIEILAKTAQNLEIQSLNRLADLLIKRGIKIGRPVDFSTIAHSKDDQTKYLFPYLEAIFQLPKMSEKEIYLLKQFIGLPPTFIQWKTITKLIKVIEEEEETWDKLILARNELKKKGWIILSEDELSFKMHRIVQDVLKEKLKPTYENLEPLIDSIATLLYIDGTKDNPIDKFQYVVYGEHILSLSFNQIKERFSTFQSNLATVYQDLGQYESARDLLQQALQSDIQNFGEDHPSTAISRSNLALVYKDLGQYESARDLLQQALQSAIQNFGEDHPSTARRRSNLALVYKDLGQYESARDLLQQALQSDIQNFGEDHPSTAIRRSNLALVYKALENNEKAKVLFGKAYATFKKSLGEDHPNTKVVKSWLDSMT